MENKTKKVATIRSACEEYVVEELKQAKKLNDNLTRANFDLANKVDKEHTKWLLLLDLIKTALNSERESYVEHNDNLVSVYVCERYIGLYLENQTENKEDEQLNALAKLIEIAQKGE